jgi:hypothetical protein
MKNKSIRPLTTFQPSEDDIRDYAYQPYQQSNGAPGHDLDYWLEATACLKANIPSHRSGTRLHQYFNGSENGGPSLVSTEAKILAS